MTMNVQLDGAFMTTRDALHDHLAQQLQLPEHYGRNLDALYDLLTEISIPVTVTLVN
jgi:ribonuclease inhibitor